MATTPCSPVDPQSLEWCEGTQVLPGIRSKVYFTPKRNIVAWPTLPTSVSAGIGDMATYAGSFTLAAGKYWDEMDILVDDSPVKSAGQGTKPGKSFLNTGTFYSPRVDEAAAGFARVANNDDYVYIFQEKTGKYRVIGNQMFLTETKVDQNTGAKATDQMGTTFEASVTDICPSPYYNGEIATADGIINEDATVSILLMSAPATNAQSVAIGTPIAEIDYRYTGVLGAITWTASVPAGIVVNTAINGAISISGTPTAAGAYSYTIPVTGSNGITATATGTITVA